jgi:hypothetical protein
MCVPLSCCVLQEPDVLLLDEPTNHLDLDAIEWLEGYLKQQVTTRQHKAVVSNSLQQTMCMYCCWRMPSPCDCFVNMLSFPRVPAPTPPLKPNYNQPQEVPMVIVSRATHCC